MFVIFRILRRFLFLGFAVFIVFILSAASAFAATCYWIGSDASCTTDNWSSSACWASSSNGTTGTCASGTPGLTDTAVFDSGDTNDANVDGSSPSLGGVTIASGYSGTITVTASGTTFFDLPFQMQSGNTATFNAGSNIVEHDGNLTLTAGTYDGGTADIRMSAGNHGIGWTINGGTLDLGTASRLYISAWNSTGNYVFQMTSGSFTAPGAGVTAHMLDGFGFTGGTFDANGGKLSISGGTGQGIANTTSGPFNDLQIGTTATTSLASSIDVNGDFIVTSSGVFNVNTYNMSIQGDLDNQGGTFLAGTGAVTFDGTDQAINGSNAIYSLVKQTAGTLTFEAGTTQTVSSNVTLEGTGVEEGALFLRSSVEDSSWSIFVPGSRSFDYVDIKDSTNTGASVSLSGKYANDSGGNSGYNFSGAISFQAGPIIPEFSFYMLVITLLVGMGMMKRKYKLGLRNSEKSL